MKPLFHFKVLLDNNIPAIERENSSAIEWKTVLMHKVAWLVMFCYSLMMVKPVVPVFMDVLAHTFWESQHLMTVHEEHGKFHMHYEVLKASGNQNDKSKPAGSYKAESEDNLYTIPASFVYHTPIHFAVTPVYATYVCSYLPSYSSRYYPPPKAIA